MNRFLLKKGDTGVPLRAVLKDAEGPVDLTGWSVRFVMTQSGQVEKKVDAAALIDEDQTTSPGNVRYEWQPEDVDTAGTFECEFICTMPNGKQVTFPRNIGANAFNIVVIVAGKT